jgi:paraquat-inducible protein B
MNEFDKTLQLVQQRLSRDDALNRELLTTLREMGGAARSMRELADNLKRHPETLIRGKSQ